MRYTCNEMSESWIEAKMDEKMTIHTLTTTTVFGFNFSRYVCGNTTAMKRSIDIAVTNKMELFIPM